MNMVGQPLLDCQLGDMRAGICKERTAVEHEKHLWRAFGESPKMLHRNCTVEFPVSLRLDAQA